LVLLAGTTFSQPRGDQQGPQTKSEQNYDEKYKNIEASAIERQQEVQEPQYQNFQRPQYQSGQSDEMGYFNNNAWLTLGTTGYAQWAALSAKMNGSIEAWVYPTSTTSLLRYCCKEML
jgi:hypothetical protein